MLRSAFADSPDRACACIRLTRQGRAALAAFPSSSLPREEGLAELRRHSLPKRTHRIGVP